MIRLQGIERRVRCWMTGTAAEAGGPPAAMRVVRAFGRSLPGARQLLVVAAVLALCAWFTRGGAPQQWFTLGVLLLGLVALVKSLPAPPRRARRIAASIVFLAAALAFALVLVAVALAGIRWLANARSTAEAAQIESARADLAARRAQVRPELPPELRVIFDGLYEQVVARLDAGDFSGAMRVRTTINEVLQQENRARVRSMLADVPCGPGTPAHVRHRAAREAAVPRAGKDVAPEPRLVGPFLRGRIDGGHGMQNDAAVVSGAVPTGAIFVTAPVGSSAASGQRRKTVHRDGEDHGTGDDESEPTRLRLSVRGWPPGTALAVAVTDGTSPGVVLALHAEPDGTAACDVEVPIDLAAPEVRVLGVAYGVPVLSDPVPLQEGVSPLAIATRCQTRFGSRARRAAMN